MRYNLAGTSYKTNSEAVGHSNGAPSTGLRGYELITNLDFDKDGDGSTWEENADGSFTLDSDDSQAPYFVTTSGGWDPVGISNTDGQRFNGVFDGNGYVIKNLAIKRNQKHTGLFGITSNAVIRNIDLISNLTDYTGNSGTDNNIGGLVGYQLGGEITASYAAGTVAGGDGNSDSVGGLVGYQSGGRIIASYALGTVTGGDGNNDYVGGLAGWQTGGRIIASYARGSVSGGEGNDSVGGLVGYQSAAYNINYIIASYATSPVDGGGGNNDSVGRLIGEQGVINGANNITASYGFGSTNGVGNAGFDGTAKPLGVTMASGLTLSNAGSAWNLAGDNTAGAWHFGTTNQNPAVNYADYDDSGTDYSCDMFSSGKCNTIIPGQGR